MTQTSQTFVASFPLSSMRTYQPFFQAAGLCKLRKPSPDQHPIRCTYAIECEITGQAYVGSTDDFFGRWYKHLNHLSNGNHSNSGLQEQFDQYGADAFKFMMLKHYPDHKGSLEQREYADGMEAYGPSNLLNARLGAVWLSYPIRGARSAYPPAKSTLARRRLVTVQ